MNCFNKTQRLLNKTDFDAVFKQANKFVTDEFVILHKANTMGNARLGMALSKKMVPKAHQRNRLKRLLREGFRCTQLPAVDVIILARQGAYKVENNKIIIGINAAWKKLQAFYAT